MTRTRPLPRETRRLRFRLWNDSERDVGAALSIYSDPEVMRWVGMRTPETTREQMLARVERRRAMFDKVGYTAWAVTLRDDPTDTPVGTIGLWPLNEGPHADAARHDERFGPMVEITYHFPRAAWGKGLAREAGRSVAAFALDLPPRGLGLPEIVATIYPENGPSVRTARAIGFTGCGPGGEHETMRLFGRDDIVLLRLSRERWGSLTQD